MQCLYVPLVLIGKHIKIKEFILKSLLVILILLLSACTNYHSDVGFMSPASLVKEINFGSEIYRQGYKDGCESGYAGYASSLTKLFHKWVQDPELAQNKVYYQIWKDAYGYCAYYAMMTDEHGLGNWR